MKKILSIIIGCIPLYTCAQKTDTKYQTLLNRVQDSLESYQDIVDTLHRDFDQDGLMDYLFIVKTNNLEKPAIETDSVYRDPFITYVSSTNKIEFFNNFLPCFNCGYMVFRKSDYFSNNEIEKDRAVIQFSKIESGVQVNFLYSLQMFLPEKELFVSSKVRILEYNDDCIKYISDEKNKLSEMDLMEDIYGDDKWYFYINSAPCD